MTWRKQEIRSRFFHGSGGLRQCSQSGQNVCFIRKQYSFKFKNSPATKSCNTGSWLYIWWIIAFNLPSNNGKNGDPLLSFQTNWASIPKIAQSISVGVSPKKKGFLPVNKQLKIVLWFHDWNETVLTQKHWKSSQIFNTYVNNFSLCVSTNTLFVSCRFETLRNKWNGYSKFKRQIGHDFRQFSPLVIHPSMSGSNPKNSVCIYVRNNVIWFFLHTSTSVLLSWSGRHELLLFLRLSNVN